jgi:predicted NAD/FAD-dependent oxidoreductase
MPAAIAGEPARYDADQRIGIAGDYLHSPRVEGAFLSGRALAERVLSTAPGVNHG